MKIELFDIADKKIKLEQKEQTLYSSLGNEYPIINGIPRFVEIKDAGQAQTSDTFGYKWNKQQEWGFEPHHTALVWAIWKDFFGWDSPAELEKLMKNKRVLDAGCGSGASMKQFIDWPSEVVGVDISNAVDACLKNFPDAKNLSLIQSDLGNLPFQDEYFDVVWSNGVLHHTPSTFNSFRALTKMAKKGGILIIYIYKKKAPIREFVDDYLRDVVSEMPHDKSWQRMQALTSFAKILSETNAEITITEELPELGFKKGTHNLQRFIYYNIMKCFWNPGFSFEHNVNVNFDWYHPKYSHRHTPEEVRGWLKELNLKENYFHESDSGIAFIAQK